MLKVAAFLTAVLSAAACAPRTAHPPASATSLPCFGAGAPAVAWAHHPDPAERSNLDHWCRGVGAPVVVAAPVTPGRVGRLLVLSWNIHVGAGRVDEVVALVRQRAAAHPAGTGIVLLLQEAFRSGDGVPRRLTAASAIPAPIRHPNRAGDIAAVARRLGMSLAYVPSMRNGPGDLEDQREDRGSAILTTEPLRDVRAIELPFGRQRRVAVMATIVPRGAPPLRVVSGHFDVARGTRRQAAYLAQYLETLAGSGPPIVLGADTNATFGIRDRAVGSLREALELEPCGHGRTSSWIARVDFMFSSLPDDVRRSCERFEQRHGSDHVPLLMTIHEWGGE